MRLSFPPALALVAVAFTGSAAAQKVLYVFNGDSASDRLGDCVSGAGDVNGDGFDDLIVGARGDDNNGADSGSVRVFSGCDHLGDIYCSPAVPNSSGNPGVISACGSRATYFGYFMLHARDLPGNQLGYFLASQAQDFVQNPGGSQGNLCLGGTIGRFAEEIQNSGPSGDFTTGGWIIKGPKNALIKAEAASDGNWGARIRKLSWAERAVDTTGYGGIEVSFSWHADNYETGEAFICEWWDGSSWTVTAAIAHPWVHNTLSVSLPAEANDNPNFKIRFRSNGNLVQEKGDVDEVRVVGTSL